MITPARPPAPNVGRFTGFVLAMVVFICLSMIGVAGFMKYELDRAEGILAAPEAAIPTNQESFGNLRRSLGYSGFVGLAQNYMASHDSATLANMKAELKNAEETVTRLPERTPTEARRDLQSILGLFNNVMQKADKSALDPSSALTAADLAPLYAALPVIDARITSAAAIDRLSAQSHMEFWATLLTFVCWASLIIAAAMSVGIYLSLKDRNSAPLRALAQSVRNMAQGDMRSSIWGMERNDMVGELARAVDTARYHFSQLPDMSLLSDQGPVRIRFEGNTKSLFEAMMQLITRDSEQVRTQAIGLTEAVKAQQDAITTLAAQVESVLHGILQRGHDGNQQVTQALQDTLASARSLKNAQEHAADQLSRIVPYLQERAHGISEITQITGKQVAQVLQSLVLTERNLKSSAELSEDALKKISTNADNLGDRLFGAINLLQASGKVLAETTETTQSRLNEAIERIAQINPGTVTRAAPDTGGSSSKLEALIASLEDAHRRMETVVSEQTQAAKAQIDLLTTHSNGLLAQTTTTAQTLSTVTDKLRDEQSRFDQAISKIGEKLDDISGRIGQTGAAALTQDPSVGQLQLADISAQIGDLSSKLASLSIPAASSAEAPAASSDLLLEIKSGFETTTRSLAQMREQLTNMVINVQSQIPVPIVPEASDSHWQDIAAKIDATRTSLSQLVTQQIDRIESSLAVLSSKTEPAVPTLPRDAQEQMEQQTQILTELVATLGVLDAHMQQLKTDMKAVRG